MIHIKMSYSLIMLGLCCCVFVSFCVLVFVRAICHGALKLNISTLFTTFFVWTSLQLILCFFLYCCNWVFYSHFVILYDEFMLYISSFAKISNVHGTLKCETSGMRFQNNFSTKTHYVPWVMRHLHLSRNTCSETYYYLGRRVYCLLTICMPQLWMEMSKCVDN